MPVLPPRPSTTKSAGVSKTSDLSALVISRPKSSRSGSGSSSSSSGSRRRSSIPSPATHHFSLSGQISNNMASLASLPPGSRGSPDKNQNNSNVDEKKSSSKKTRSSITHDGKKRLLTIPLSKVASCLPLKGVSLLKSSILPSLTSTTTANRRSNPQRCGSRSSLGGIVSGRSSCGDSRGRSVSLSRPGTTATSESKKLH